MGWRHTRLTFLDKPDVFVWLGDVAYTDHPLHFAPMRVDYIKDRYDQTRNALGYSKLAEKTKIVGVWDDHDFGTNDGGRHFPHKQQNRDFWLDFIGEAIDSERRLQKVSPIHQDYFITKGSTTVHLILLDNRFENDNDSLFGSGDVLGED